MTHSKVSDEIAEGKDCWYCGEPLIEGNPVSIEGLILGHNSCRPTYTNEE